MAVPIFVYYFMNSKYFLKHFCCVCVCVWTSVQYSRSVMSDSLWPLGQEHARLPCPSLTPGVCSNSCPSSRWCYPTISSSVIPFSFCLQSFPASVYFPMSPFFFIRWLKYWSFSSASVLPVNIHNWFSIGFPGGSDHKASACNERDLGSFPGSGRSPEEGNGKPLQYSCLENLMDGGTW